MASDGAPAGGGGGGLGGTLKSKMGPFPVWVWLALITAVALVWWLYEQHKSGGTSSTPAATPEQAGTPGVVVINQDEPGETTGTTPPPEPKHKTGGLPRHPHKVTKAQARELLSHGNDVYQIDRGGAYVPITKLAGVHVQLYTGEKGWAFLQEPDKGKLPGGKVGKVPTGKSHKVTRPKAA